MDLPTPCLKFTSDFQTAARTVNCTVYIVMWICLNLTENVVLGPRVLEGRESPNHLHLQQENSSKRRDP